MTGADKGMVAGFKHIYDHEGVKGFYSGWWSLSCRELPFSLIEMMLYENVRAMWAKYTGKGDAAISRENPKINFAEPLNPKPQNNFRGAPKP